MEAVTVNVHWILEEVCSGVYQLSHADVLRRNWDLVSIASTLGLF